MDNSILNNIKKLLGIPESDTAFDVDIIIHINSVFMALQQLGVGPETVFEITDNTTEWSSFLIDPVMYSAVKSYIYLKVRSVFDPPGTSFHGAAIKEQIQELEWRLMIQVPIPPEPIV